MDFLTYLPLPAHNDAIWGIACASLYDRTVSISADGSIKAWDSTVGQVSHSQPPHPLGLVSLSLSNDGNHALYNSIEGLTTLWDLENAKIVGRFESYAKSADVSGADRGK